MTKQGKDTKGTDLSPMDGLLQGKPQRSHLFAALRRLEIRHANKNRFGEGLRPADEAIRLGQEPSLAFATTTVTAVQPERSGRPAALRTGFFGVFGPNGPLPLHMTEYALQRLKNAGDPTFVRFADIFHHRLLSLFYRAFANGEPTVNRDRRSHDAFAQRYLGSVIGLGFATLRRRDPLGDEVKLYYAGRLSAPGKGAAGLQAMVSDFFGVPATVEEFIPEWVQTPPATRWRLGAGMLGRQSVLGRRVRLCQSRIRIVIGPLDRSERERFAPGGPVMAQLAAMVRGYAGAELAWDVRLRVRGGSQVPYRIGGPSRLGWSAWLGVCPQAKIEESVIIEPQGGPSPRKQ